MKKIILPVVAAALFVLLGVLGCEESCRDMNGQLVKCETVNAASCNQCVDDEGRYYTGGMCEDECLADASCYGENATECPAVDEAEAEE